MTRTEKRLIALSSLGIWIEHESGHRWIESHNTESFSFDLAQERAGIYANKIYQGIESALNEVDEVLKAAYGTTLEAICDGLIKNYDNYDFATNEKTLLKT